MLEMTGCLVKPENNSEIFENSEIWKIIYDVESS